MAKYLLIDFGSTFTKLTAVDTEIGDIIGTAAHFTTVAEDIRIGYHNALSALKTKIGNNIKFDRIDACSSAAGGLKMAAIGLVEEMTVEAAKRVCLGAGAKVDLVFSHHLNRQEVQTIIEEKIDIILLAGGADGGNSECVLFNADLLGQMGVKISIVYAGNKSCQDEIKAIFDRYGLDGIICENVMPRINQLNIEDARNRIRDLFLKKIIVAKGIKKIEAEIDEVVLPTPEAVLHACELFSKGYLDEKGQGDIVVVDVGGATTDMYSLCPATKRSDVVLGGLEEPFAKRTVEGDLGIRYSSLGILKAISQEEITMINQTHSIDIVSELKKRHEDPSMLPIDEHDEQVDQLIAQMCTYKAMTRHAGKMEEVFSPMGMVFHQTGKDLSDVDYVIGTGGPIIKAKHPVAILSQTTDVFRKSSELRPQHPQYMLDKDYILSAMGLLVRIDPVLALKIMKKHIIKL
ncbi:MAG: methylaspartate mutase accessory protein GlmL [Candidatus Izemoplasmatales bacterium]|jgi:uncharacterized protein (TIGR01319 family)|nr:methylaspartate mutase accessory protein GlmL [Candidatus Izemoplasmatales bacterium]MDD3865128.1 methylaspartate mutase accessory protein GlmL [Candidatus Izemoplasmatales bacterium]